MTDLDHPAIRALTGALHRAGMTGAAEGIRVLTDEVRTAALAASALGVPVGAIANSLVFRAEAADGHDGDHDGGHDAEELPLLVLTSGAHRADTARLAELVGAAAVRKADPAFVRAHTGQAIGGVAPVGHPKPVRTLVDTHLARYEVVWAAAGHPRSVFPTTFEALLTLTGGTAADVAEQKDDFAS